MPKLLSTILLTSFRVGGLGEISTSVSANLTTVTARFIRPEISFQLTGGTHEEFLFQGYLIFSLKSSRNAVLDGS